MASLLRRGDAGGTANCSVIITDGEIGYPMLSMADYCIIMNDASLEKFEKSVYPRAGLCAWIALWSPAR